MKRLQFREFEIAKHHNPEEAAIDSKTKATYKSIYYQCSNLIMIIFVQKKLLKMFTLCVLYSFEGNDSKLHV